jgi:3-deoxy-7-phosphoheptulonate synthase
MSQSMKRKIEDSNVTGYRPLITPVILKQEIPLTRRGRETVTRGRYEITESINGRDKRIVLVVGQCSIHDTESDAEYSKRLLSLSRAVEDVFVIAKRVYFEKPRTTVGWKGLIYDPNLDGKENINKGLRIAREILARNAEMGLFSGTEFLDPFVPQYLGDMISWAAIGARTVQSSVHRQMASGLSMPVGFKNSTQGDVKVAVQAVIAASKSQWFLGMDQNGTVSAVTTRGNPDTHIILRGGEHGPNYSAANVGKAQAMLKENGLASTLMVDCSHGNSNKDYRMQSRVFRNVIGQILRGNTGIKGLMLESNINEGSQPIPSQTKNLKYGVSVTDSCIGWEETERLILDAHRLLRK